MSVLDDLNALFEQLKNSPSALRGLFGGDPPANVSDQVKALQQQRPNLQAEIEASWKKGLELQAEQEAYLKRLRGEEVESDKEKEGDLDTVPDRFEAEQVPKPEEVNDLVQRLRKMVEPEQRPTPNAKARR